MLANAASLTCVIPANGVLPEQKVSASLKIQLVDNECDPYELRNCNDPEFSQQRDHADWKILAAPLTLVAGSDTFSTNDEYSLHSGAFEYYKGTSLLYAIESRGTNSILEVAAVKLNKVVGDEQIYFNAAVTHLVREDNKFVTRLNKVGASCVIK